MGFHKLAHVHLQSHRPGSRPVQIEGEGKFLVEEGTGLEEVGTSLTEEGMDELGH
jgi:hypothetical protein